MLNRIDAAGAAEGADGRIQLHQVGEVEILVLAQRRQGACQVIAAPLIVRIEEGHEFCPGRHMLQRRVPANRSGIEALDDDDARVVAGQEFCELGARRDGRCVIHDEDAPVHIAFLGQHGAHGLGQDARLLLEIRDDDGNAGGHREPGRFRPALRRRRMTQEAGRACGEAVSARLQHDDQIAHVRLGQLHPVGEQVERRAQRADDRRDLALARRSPGCRSTTG